MTTKTAEIFRATNAAGVTTYHHSRASAVHESGRYSEIVPYIVEGTDDLDDVTISADRQSFTVNDRNT